MPKPSPRDPELQLRYTQIMQRYRECVTVFCSPKFRYVLERSGPTLLTVAAHAGDTDELRQRVHTITTLLDAQREVVLERVASELETGFIRFYARARLGAYHDVPPDERNGETPRPVIAEHTLEQEYIAFEETLATENIIIKTNANCFPELYALSQRLAMINHGRKLKDADIPAGPRQLVHSFRRALAPLALDIGVKIILYALVQQHVTADATTLYTELNTLLRSNGILQRTHPINLRHQRGKGQAQVAPPPTDTLALDNGLFATMLELVSTRRGSYAALPEPRQRLLSDAIETQPLDVFLRTLIGTTALSPTMTITLDDSIRRVTSEYELALANSFSVDTAQNVITTVGRWFETLLISPLLPAVVKATLSGLHTPYLLLALRDRNVLTNQRHPARRLLDDLVEAGSLWVDESNLARGIFPTLQIVVDRIAQTAEAEVSLFEHLHSKLRRHMTAQRRPSERLEQRAQDILQGRTAARQARQQAVQLLQMLTAPHALPEPVRVFLDSTWLDLMTLILLRKSDGPDSPMWHETVATAAQLVGLFDPLVNHGELQNRIHDLPRLRQRLVNGIARLGSYNHAVFTALDALLSQPRTLRDRTRSQQHTVTPTALPAAPTPARPTVRSSHLAATKEEEALAAAVKQPDFALQAMIERLRETPLGTWFEVDTVSAAPQRLRLLWISPLTTACTFASHTGEPATLRNLGELAQAILRGRARVLTEENSTTTWRDNDE